MRLIASCLSLVILASTPACSLKRAAVNRLGDALAEGTGTYAADDDPELVRDASPFALKTLEALLETSPKHPGLLLAAASGFPQYAHAFLQDEADYTEARDRARATELRARARKMYLRARGYGLRGLEVALPGFGEGLRADPAAALARAGQAQVPLLYYTAASWAAAFALDITDPTLAVGQGTIEQMARRALALDPAWDGGALGEFLLAWEAGHASAGGSRAEARRLFEEVVKLSPRRASAYVTFAEAVPLEAQDRAGFESLLKTALAVDPDRDPARRTATLVAQRRARWLLSRTAELFNDEPTPEPKP